MFLDKADCKKTFSAKRSSKTRLSALKRLKYSVCKRAWPRTYTEHILEDPVHKQKYDAKTPTYRGHELSKHRRRSAKKPS